MLFNFYHQLTSLLHIFAQAPLPIADFYSNLIMLYFKLKNTTKSRFSHKQLFGTDWRPRHGDRKWCQTTFFSIKYERTKERRTKMSIYFIRTLNRCLYLSNFVLFVFLYFSFKIHTRNLYLEHLRFISEKICENYGKAAFS